MFRDKNKSSRKKAHNNQQLDAWTKLVSVCTNLLGGFYNINGSIYRSTSFGITPQIDEQQSQIASLAERTHQRVRHVETKRQVNIEEILSIAGEISSGNALSANVDDDWVNLFFSYAQDVSSPKMQFYWARALASEIRRPGTISKRSLSFLWHCDPWEIKAFEKVMAFAFLADNGHPFIFRTNVETPEDDPIFTEMRMLSVCISAGLISLEPSPLPLGFGFNYVGERQVVCSGASMFGNEVGYYVQRFTKIGSDLFRLMEDADIPPQERMQKQIVWNFISDFIDLSQEPLAQSA